MKIIIDGYEVEIKAKKVDFGHTKFNKDDTLHLLNNVLVMINESADWNNEHGYEACGTLNSDLGKTLYKALKSEGLYRH